jgi:hypothetical protein
VNIIWVDEKITDVVFSKGQKILDLNILYMQYSHHKQNSHAKFKSIFTTRLIAYWIMNSDDKEFSFHHGIPPMTINRVNDTGS